MKGYCVDVRGFSVEKKKLVVKAIKTLTGCCGIASIWEGQERLGNVSRNGNILGSVVWGGGKASENQTPYTISFNDLMIEAGFNYEDRGVEGFGEIDSFKGVKITTNKTRPLITREQYDEVMAQSDKRTFTKALDDLLVIEKEQLLDESAIRIKQLEKDNGFLSKAFESWRESHEKLHYSKLEIEAKLEKHKRISGVLSLLLISSVAAQLAVIFLQ